MNGYFIYSLADHVMKSTWAPPFESINCHRYRIICPLRPKIASGLPDCGHYFFSSLSDLMVLTMRSKSSEPSSGIPCFFKALFKPQIMRTGFPSLPNQIDGRWQILNSSSHGHSYDGPSRARSAWENSFAAESVVAMAVNDNVAVLILIKLVRVQSVAGIVSSVVPIYGA